MNDRELQLATGMIDSGERRIGNLKLRPYTMGSMQLAYLLKLTMFTRGKDDPPLELDDLEEQRQIMAFAWMQSADEDDIADAVRDDTVDRCVLKFSLNVTFDEFRKRYESLDWCEANANHPIAYLRAMNDQHNRLLDKVKTMRPMLLIRKGKRIAIVPSGSDEASKATREQILSEF